MAAIKKRSASVDNVGHFYYDWALSRYRWTPDDARDKQNNHLIQDDGSSTDHEKGNAKKQVNGAPVVAVDGLTSIRLDKRDNVKEPFKNRDVNRPITEEKRIKPVLCELEEGIAVLSDPTRTKSISSELTDEIELTSSHTAMISVLSSRLLRLRAAETLWHKDTNTFLEYVLRLKDDSLLVDVLPLLTNRVKDNAPEGQALSMGACLEMLPALERLLKSKFEDYIVVALNMVREMIKRWWAQLKAATSHNGDPNDFRCSRSVSGLYMAMVSISAIIAQLKTRKGRVAEKALIVSRLLDLL